MYSKYIAVGYLGKDPEMRFAPSGTAVTSFSVATNKEYTKDNQKIKETTWIRVSCWGKQAEACNQYLKKGSMVLVEGTLIVDPATGGPKIWTDKEGIPHTGFEVNASTVRFLSSSGQKDSYPDGEERDYGNFN